MPAADKPGNKCLARRVESKGYLVLHAGAAQDRLLSRLRRLSRY